MVSEPGDYIGQGVPREFDSTNASVTAGGSTTQIGIGVSGGTSGHSFDLSFAAPSGSILAIGFYDRAQRTAFRSAGRAGIDISGEGRGCNEITGRFEVRDIKFDAGGSLKRLWLLYEQHCEGAAPALFGEVRIRQPQPSANLLVAPAAITWPDLEGKEQGVTVPVTVRSTSTTAVTMGTVQVTGPQASDFLIRLDACSGLTLHPGESCQVYVRSAPKARGPRLASLRLANTSDVRPSAVQMTAGVAPGKTAWAMTSDAGDFIGQGRTYSWTPGNAAISVSGSTSGVHAVVSAADGSTWSADFVPGSGDIIAVGTYSKATRYPFNGSGPGMSVDGDGRGCNTLKGSFEVKQVAFSPVDGSLVRLALAFVQHCEGGVPALRGQIDYRAASDTTPPALVSQLTSARTATNNKVTLTWRNPEDIDLSRVVVRYFRGTTAPQVVTAGLPAYSGSATSVTLGALDAASTYSYAAFSVDKTGNVSRPSVVVVAPG